MFDVSGVSALAEVERAPSPALPSLAGFAGEGEYDVVGSYA